jgi:hypothetical protein
VNSFRDVPELQERVLCLFFPSVGRIILAMVLPVDCKRLFGPQAINPASPTTTKSKQE